MMTPVQFRQHSGKYNRGEVAGFLPQRAAQLIASGVAVAYRAPTKAVAASADPEAMALAQAAQDVARRAADLDAREAALAARESALAKPADTGKTDAATKPVTGSEAGSPPAQGGKTAAKPEPKA
ncbi:hypothetical protein DL237_09965 [Pseudooceanicola sediminis]|uniref:Uncharacterized protein n=1 Tax=Pseudooceanicola sediminis TaxID=2211117 RepID=A0A399J175_9RHOB|nr:hypothetical protein [Pseudooceanicola sediminis]RII38994.1 hypothetical protein DL237_09965 [Pseudooceanicola sediminis]